MTITKQDSSSIKMSKSNQSLIIDQNEPMPQTLIYMKLSTKTNSYFTVIFDLAICGFEEITIDLA